MLTLSYRRRLQEGHASTVQHDQNTQVFIHDDHLNKTNFPTDNACH